MAGSCSRINDTYTMQPPLPGRRASRTRGPRRVHTRRSNHHAIRGRTKRPVRVAPGGTPSRTLRHQPGARRRRLVNTQAPGTARGYIGGAVLRSLAFRFYSQLGARLAQPASGPSLRGAAREEKGEETRASSSRLGHRHWLGLVARSGLLRPHAS